MIIALIVSSVYEKCLKPLLSADFCGIINEKS